MKLDVFSPFPTAVRGDPRGVALVWPFRSWAILALICSSIAAPVAAQESSAPAKAWEWDCLDTRRLQREESANPDKLVETAETRFRQHPLDPPGDVLVFWELFVDRENGNSVLVFETLLQSDTEVIYVFDNKGEILDYFARSTWRFAEEDGPASAAYRIDCRPVTSRS